MSSRWKTFTDRFGSYSGMLIICVCGLLLLILGGILPTSHGINATRAEIADLRASLERREALLPMHNLLVEQKNSPVPTGFTLPERARLPIADLPSVPSKLILIAREAGVELIAATPQLRSIQNGSDAVRVDTHIRGDYMKMRDFLLRLGEMPYLDRIEGMTVQTMGSGREMQLILWLGMQ